MKKILFDSFENLSLVKDGVIGVLVALLMLRIWDCNNAAQLFAISVILAVLVMWVLFSLDEFYIRHINRKIKKEFINTKNETEKKTEVNLSDVSINHNAAVEEVEK